MDLSRVNYNARGPYVLRFCVSTGYTQKAYGKVIKCKTCKDSFFTDDPRTKGYCSKSCAQIGKPSKNWRGGRIVDGSGYIYLQCPNHPHAIKTGYVFEHRLVMERKLGRYLKPNEEVHHINGIKNDNRPENLRLFPDKSLHSQYERNSQVQSLNL